MYARWTRGAVEPEYSLTPVTAAIPAADGRSGASLDFKFGGRGFGLLFLAADGQFVAGNHRGGVDTSERRRQSRECALEEQTRSRAAFSHNRVGEALVESSDHHVDRDVTLQLISSVIHGNRFD